MLDILVRASQHMGAQQSAAHLHTHINQVVKQLDDMAVVQQAILERLNALVPATK